MKGSILPWLKSRLEQLENRQMMIPRYVERPGKFVGSKNDYSLDDLPHIKQQIGEVKAAIKAVEQWHKDEKENQQSQQNLAR